MRMIAPKCGNVNKKMKAAEKMCPRGGHISLQKKSVSGMLVGMGLDPSAHLAARSA